MKAQYQRRYGRFAGVPVSIVMIIGAILITAAAASAKTITVTGTGDSISVDGIVTLREAMTAAKNNAASGDAPAGDPGLDTIKFNIPGAGLHTITLTSELPGITGDPIFIDGTSQPGYAGLAPVIEINGNNISGTGFFITAGSSSIKALTINHFTGRAIILSAGGGNAIVGNYIGTNAAGTAAIPNTQDGILIQSGSSNNVIGGTGGNRNVISGNGASGIAISDGSNNFVRSNYIGTSAAGTAAIGNGGFGIRIFTSNNQIGGAGFANVISGNGRGVGLELGGTGNTVSANFIGTNFNGTAAIANAQDGILIAGANNTIGGLAAGARNIISGNTTNGVLFTGSQAMGNFVQGNYIGTNAAGTASLANGSYGIRLIDGSNNTIGGTTAAARNVISGNGRGVNIGGVTASGNTVQGNYIGLNAAGTAKLANNGAGVELDGPNNFVGGTAAGAGNVISGNLNQGITASASGNQIKGNLIGTNPAGTAALGNSGGGIRMINCSSNIIGGTTAGARNIISGNGSRGISIENAQSANNLVQGNYIGVDINGTAKIANAGSGVAISGTNNTVGSNVAGGGNVISGNSGDGVDLFNEVSGNKIQGNLIGTNAAGTALLANTGIGIRVIDAFSNLIGGTDPAARNVISGNFRGITLEGDNGQNTVQGNFIGTDITGALDFGNNQEGISIGQSNNTIGGTAAGARNLISGNDTDGVRIDGAQASSNLVQGNFIGTKADGVSPLPNTLLGVDIFGSSNNTIGGTAAGAGNTIAENSYAGVLISSGTGNAVLGNSLFNNARLGIEFDGEDALGLLANDPGDSDFGANWRQNYPLLTSVIAAGGNTSIQGTLNSNPNKQFRIEFFSNTACDGSGFGEGRTFLGSTTVNTDANGNAAINVSLPVSPVGNFVTATATSPTNDTSEFSPCALVGGPNPGALQFASSFFIVEEAQGTAKITVTRSNGMAGAVTVHYATSNGSATTPADYTATSGTLSFADGEVIKTFTIPVVDDGVPEQQENVVLTLSNPTGGATLGGNSSSSLLINNSDPAFPAVSFSDATLNEGDSGAANMVFTISLTPHSVPVTVGYTTANGSATSPDDYQFTSGQLIFNPGQNSKQVSVPVFGDTQKEGDELFFLNLTTLSVGYVLDGQGNGLIIDDDSVSKYHFSSSTFSVNENGNSVDITVQRVGDTSAATSVAYETSNDTATAGQDYVATSGIVSFAIGETSKTFPVTINDDTTYEGDETVNLTLKNPSAGGQLTSPSTAVLTIVENDQPQIPVPGSLAFSASAYSVNENLGIVTVTVNRTGGTSGAVSVHYATVPGGSATDGDDYTSVSGMLNWADGDSSAKTFNVPLQDDSIHEPNETINLALTNPAGGATLGNQSSAHIDIVDDDPIPTITIDDISRSEGDNGTTGIDFTLTLSAPSTQTVTVKFATADGTAIFGNDYQPDSGTVTFVPGEHSQQVTIMANGDTLNEPDETFFVNLSSPTNATLGKAQGIGTILNDDSLGKPVIEFDAAAYTVAEDSGALTVTVTRTGDTSIPSTVNYNTTDTDTFSVNCAFKQGQAYGRCDFATTVGTLNFAAGETSKTFSIPVIDDSYGEGDETFGVVLSNATGGSLGAVSSAVVTITDNESADLPTPIFNTSFFVRQHYLDFLSREPEQGEPWSAILNNCIDPNNTDPNSPSAACDRITVSGAFFGSPEFRNKGIYVIDFYRAAFNRLPTYVEFSFDLASITGATAAEANAKRAAFADNFVQRPEFTNIYNGSNTSFVNGLMAGMLGNNYNLTSITTFDPMNPDGPTKMALTNNDLISGLNNNTLTRAQVLRALVQSDQVLNLEAVNAFVASQYYGYLRRTPEPAGFNAWVTYLKNNPNDFRTMVNGFLNSAEYKLRFGP